MAAKIVLGLGFGDEGKGITTDYLCHQHRNASPIVVRFSGGHQVGHGVTVDGLHHIFSSFGSGTLRGVPTYYTEYCTFYPLTYRNELKVLHFKGIKPIVYFHPFVKVTTPMDVIFNKIKEREKSHGSCGLGIGSTMNRHLKDNYKLFVMDLSFKNIFLAKLENIEKYYLNLLSNHDTQVFLEEWRYLKPQFLEAIKFNGHINLLQTNDLSAFTTFIFEGSQGILLDMDHGFFPNVTYANTTSKNAMAICKELGEDNIEIFNVTRCYQTRHGNGWMSDEQSIRLINANTEDNKINAWQGQFRLGELDYELLKYSLKIDSEYSTGAIHNLVVTCLDQRPDFVFSKAKMRGYVVKTYGSYSPDSKDFKLL